MRLDHLLLGIADLDDGIRQYHDLTGVEPWVGGRHPEMGTRNALVSLGDSAAQGSMEYLEIIAPDPAGEPARMFERLSSLDRLTPVMWAMAVDDADRVAARLTAEGHAVVGPRKGSRVQPDGDVLEWRLVTTPERAGFAPFFIEWAAGAIHPSVTAPAGCSLAAMEITDPEPAALRDLLDPLAPRARLRAAPRAALSVSLDCPRGRVNLSSS